jgi:hypothetical protein
VSRLASAHADAPDADRLVQISWRLGERSFWLPEQFVYHAFLTERPHPVTWREFRAVIGSTPARTADAVRTWVVEHARARGVAEGAVLRDLFSTAVRAHEAAMEKAISAMADAAMRAHCVEIERALDLIEMIAFEMQAFATADAALRMAEFIQLMQECVKWAHFRCMSSCAVGIRRPGGRSFVSWRTRRSRCGSGSLRRR